MYVQSPPYLKRVQRVQSQLTAHQVILFSHPAEIQYLTGFDQFLLPYEREAVFVCTSTQVCLLHPHFLTLDHHLFLEYRLGCTPQDISRYLLELSQSQGKIEVQYDPSSLYVAELNCLQSVAATLVPLKNRFLTEPRMYKDKVEVARLCRAAHITNQVVTEVISTIQEGQTEKIVAQTIDRLFLQYGADSPAFPTIVAFGSHSALPHHQPSDKQLQQDAAVLIDCGARYQGYCGDMTRSFWFGHKPAEEYNSIKQLVDQAYAGGLQLLKLRNQEQKPIRANELDACCRSTISDGGYQDQFIHTSGHSLGLEIHEPPSISRFSEQELLPNMLLTLEPGIYVPNKFGYRYENTLLIQEKGVVEVTTPEVTYVS